MTKHLVSIFMIAASIPLVAADTHKLMANVPFNFTAAGTVFQAGDYQITREAGVVTIRTADRSKAAMVLTNSVEANSPSATGRLVFLRSGEQYFLSEIWEPGNSSGSVVPPSNSKERELRSRNGVPARARVSVALR